MINHLIAAGSLNSAEQIGYHVGVVLAATIMIGSPILCIWSVFKFFKSHQKGYLVLSALSGIPTAIFLVAVTMGFMEGFKTEAAYIDGETELTSNSAVRIGDSPLRVSFPAHWDALKDINPNATFQAGNLRREEYFLAFAYHKLDLDSNIETLYYAFLNEFEVSLSGLRIIEERELNLLGRPARQSEIAGTVGDVNIVYLDTLFEGDDHYYRLLQWTLPSKQTQAMAEFHKVIASIAESVP